MTGQAGIFKITSYTATSASVVLVTEFDPLGFVFGGRNEDEATEVIRNWSDRSGDTEIYVDEYRDWRTAQRAKDNDLDDLA